MMKGGGGGGGGAEWGYRNKTFKCMHVHAGSFKCKTQSMHDSCLFCMYNIKMRGTLETVKNTFITSHEIQ